MAPPTMLDSTIKHAFRPVETTGAELKFNSEADNADVKLPTGKNSILLLSENQ